MIFLSIDWMRFYTKGLYKLQQKKSEKIWRKVLKSNNLETYFDNVNKYFPSVVKNNILQSVFNQQQIKLIKLDDFKFNPMSK